MRDFRDLAVWQTRGQKALQLGLGIYRATRTFPPEERYSLTARVKEVNIVLGAFPRELTANGEWPSADATNFAK